MQRVVDVGPVPDAPSSNASYTLDWTGTTLNYVEKTLDGVTYRRTVTTVGGSITAISVWVAQ